MRTLAFPLLGAIFSFTLLAVPSAATAVCGDGVVDAGEDCDDGNDGFEAGESCAAECSIVACGHASGSAGARPIATDALLALKAVVGIDECDACVCDTDGSGQASATDVLRILAAAVGQDVTLNCGACADLVRHGSLTVTPVLPILQTARDEILAEKSALEALGYMVSGDGSLVTWPEAPARGWLVRMGDKRVLSDSDGAFTLSISRGEETVGSIAHPGQPDTPIFELQLDELARPEDPPFEVEMELTFAGPCGMNSDAAVPDPQACEEILGGSSTAYRRQAHAGHEHGHHHAAHDAEDGAKADGDVSAASQFDPEDAMESRRLGTYPLGNQSCCRDYDGNDYDQGTVHGTLLNYMGSTCATLVDLGCCANELGSLSAAGRKAVGALEQTSCKPNHRGRYCQEVLPRDMAVDVNGTIASPAGINLHEVSLGETVDMIEHNNGCFGTTYLEKTRNDIGGRFVGDFVSEEIGHIIHFTGAPPNLSYSADREFVYEVPKCVDAVTGFERDVYLFSTDGISRVVTFALKTTNLWRCVDDGRIFSGDTTPVSPPDEDCPMYHKEGAHPCDGSPDPGDPCGHGVVEPVTHCGDGVVEFGEECEASDDSACPGQCVDCDCPGLICGNGIVNAGEECDAPALGNCPAGCSNECRCVPEGCGNNVVEMGEECDGVADANCPDLCIDADCLCVECGNDRKDPTEDCDGADDAACPGLCSPECGCMAPPPVCGDGNIDPGEQCEMDFHCHLDGSSCLPDCTCSNACSETSDCGAGERCFFDTCILECMGPADCPGSQSCSLLGLDENDMLGFGCTIPYPGPGAGPVGSQCDSGAACSSYLCDQFSYECTEVCYAGLSAQSQCPGGACKLTFPSLHTGFCGTSCVGPSSCRGDQDCQFSFDYFDNLYTRNCGLPFGAGEAGDACTEGQECNSLFCGTPPGVQAACFTNADCSGGSVCSPYRACVNSFCAFFCENDSDCTDPGMGTCTGLDITTPDGVGRQDISICGPP